MSCLRGFLVVLLLMVSGIVPAQAPSPGTTGSPGGYVVAYTGSLFGYFRYPEVQQIGMLDCPAQKPSSSTDQPNTYAPEAARFLEVREDWLAYPPDLFVAMGDNFAPFLLARQVVDQDLIQRDPKKGLLQPKENYPLDLPRNPNDTKNTPLLHIDNVACFMRLAHVDAIVPGKHDFYFGPDRLRNLQPLLEAPATTCKTPQDPCYRPVHILGANLSLKVQRTDTTQKGQGTPHSAETGSAELHFLLPKVVLPWMRSVKIKIKIPGNTVGKSIEICRGETGSIAALYRKDFADDRCKAFTLTSDKCTPDPALQSTEETKCKLPELLMSKRPYYLFAWNGNQKDPEAKPSADFTVEETFFTGNPWVLDQNRQIAVFGVVDQNMAEFVGRLNDTWVGLELDGQTHDHSYETIVDVSDPIEALTQALEFCSQYPQCATAHKVLLAQMPESEVNRSLAPRLPSLGPLGRFDVVITQADTDTATGNRTSHVTAGKLREPDPLQRPTVLVPGFLFGVDPQYDRYQLNVYLNSAVIDSQTDGEAKYRHVENHAYSQSLPLPSTDPFNHCLAPLNQLFNPDSCQQNASVLADRLTANKLGIKPLPQNPTGNKAWTERLEEVALRAMRDACHSDIAMLQQRDVFLSPNLVSRDFSPQGIRAAIGAIFWKGDFVQCISIPGQTISSMLQHSDELQRQEDSGEAIDLSKGWPLAVSGITRAASPTPASEGANPVWVVNGQYLDPKKLYSVAVTDYLANGDTGYSELKNAEPPPQIALYDLCLRRVTDLVATALIPSAPQVECDTNPYLLDAKDSSNQKPPKTVTDNFAAWTRSWSYLNVFEKTNNNYQFYEQQRRAFFLRLYKLDFSYSLFQHNPGEGSIPKNFPGVTVVDLSGQDSESFTADYQARSQYMGRTWEIYIESGANFGRRNQRNKSSPFGYQVSQTANADYTELGYARRLVPDYQNPSGLKLIIPVAMKTQLFAPLTQIALPNVKGSGANPIAAPRNYYLSLRPGFRFEHSFPRPDSGPSQSQGGGKSTPSQDPAQSAASGSKGQGKTSGGQGQQGQGQGQGQNQSSTLNSYIEFGFETGEMFHSPSAFQFSNPGATLPACVTGLVSVSNLVECVNDLGSNSPKGQPAPQLVDVFANRNFRQSGIYLNFRIDAPLPGNSTAEYIIENRGDLFFKSHSDTVVDTRFLDDLKSSLLLPIYGKFSVGPSFELVMFKTKVGSGNYYVSYSTSVSLNYNFEWRPGLKWRKALGFGTPEVSPNPLPSK